MVKERIRNRKSIANILLAISAPFLVGGCAMSSEEASTWGALYELGAAINPELTPQQRAAARAAASGLYNYSRIQSEKEAAEINAQSRRDAARIQAQKEGEKPWWDRQEPGDPWPGTPIRNIITHKDGTVVFILDANKVGRYVPCKEADAYIDTSKYNTPKCGKLSESTFAVRYEPLD